MKFLTSILVSVIIFTCCLKGATIFQVFQFDESDFSFSKQNTTSEDIQDQPFSSQPNFTTEFDRFDPALGTLNSVTIEFNLVFSGLLEIPSDIGSGSGSGSYGFFGPVMVDGEEIATFGQGTGNGGPAGETKDFQFAIASTLTPITSDLTNAMVTGTGKQTLFVDFTGVYSLDEGVTMSGQLETDTFGHFSRIVVAYDYTPIPEPAKAATWAGVLLFLLTPIYRHLARKKRGPA